MFGNRTEKKKETLIEGVGNNKRKRKEKEEGINDQRRKEEELEKELETITYKYIGETSRSANERAKNICKI